MDGVIVVAVVGRADAGLVAFLGLQREPAPEPCFFLEGKVGMIHGIQVLAVVVVVVVVVDASVVNSSFFGNTTGRRISSLPGTTFSLLLSLRVMTASYFLLGLFMGKSSSKTQFFPMKVSTCLLLLSSS